MPNYLEYQKSIAAEFKAYEKRVRNLIDSAHWGEEGRYKEIILMNYLRRVLTNDLSVGTGFVRNGEKITRQIDIIIYDNSYPVLFSEGDFVVTTPENVVGIIEVKSRINRKDICDIMEKSNRNGKIIVGDSNRFIFNGIFSYESGGNSNSLFERMKQHDFSYLLKKLHFNQIIPQPLSYCVNHIAYGSETLIKLWTSNPNYGYQTAPYYSLYNLSEGLAFSYFLSNLQEFVIRKVKGYSLEEQNLELHSFYYPLKEGKEAHLIGNIDLNSAD
ncbi:hypothetical protein M3603_10965 [Rummeliibacillus stabekisii]|uniref:DUF6602 domain-containing protein n=1 Tax=Rummeliibacillus stabekisii TaxID=241244 RepID=UPI00204200DA|nr:DUF6602 domain-containing protein [Rummeliibacillus stabekisii]MCM3317168.1 hypothetical protein [Rummeliibacillus stabekisii]